MGYRSECSEVYCTEEDEKSYQQCLKTYGGKSVEEMRKMVAEYAEEVGASLKTRVDGSGSVDGGGSTMACHPCPFRNEEEIEQIKNMPLSSEPPQPSAGVYGKKFTCKTTMDDWIQSKKVEVHDKKTNTIYTSLLGRKIDENKEEEWKVETGGAILKEKITEWKNGDPNLRVVAAPGQTWIDWTAYANKQISLPNFYGDMKANWGNLPNEDEDFSVNQVPGGRHGQMWTNLKEMKCTREMQGQQKENDATEFNNCLKGLKSVDTIPVDRIKWTPDFLIGKDTNTPLGLDWETYATVTPAQLMNKMQTLCEESSPEAKCDAEEAQAAVNEAEEAVMTVNMMAKCNKLLSLSPTELQTEYKSRKIKKREKWFIFPLETLQENKKIVLDQCNVIFAKQTSATLQATTSAKKKADLDLKKAKEILETVKDYSGAKAGILYAVNYLNALNTFLTESDNGKDHYCNPQPPKPVRHGAQHHCVEQCVKKEMKKETAEEDEKSKPKEDDEDEESKRSEACEAHFTQCQTKCKMIKKVKTDTIDLNKPLMPILAKSKYYGDLIKQLPQPNKKERNVNCNTVLLSKYFLQGIDPKEGEDRTQTFVFDVPELLEEQKKKEQNKQN